MATRTIELTGPIRWARVFEENRDMEGYEGAFKDHGGAYTVDIGLDSDNFQKLKDAGSMKKGKEEDDGLTWVKLTRKHEDRFEWASGAPKVTDATGSTLEHEDGLIGNGSEAVLKVSVYDTSRPRIKGTRLEEVQITRKLEIEPSVAKDADRIPF